MPNVSDLLKAAPMTLGKRLRAIRKKAGLSQVRLGELVGTTSQAVNQWESDKSQPSRMNLLKVAEALNISVSALLQPHVLPEGATQVTLDGVHGVVSGGRVVPLIDAQQLAVEDKFSVQQSIVSCSFPCSPKSFALPVLDSAQEPAIPEGSVIVFDPTVKPTPGKFVVAMQGGKPLMGILSCTVPGDKSSRVVTPLNSHWPAWSASEQKPITIYGVKTELHTAG